MTTGSVAKRLTLSRHASRLYHKDLSTFKYELDLTAFNDFVVINKMAIS